MPYRRKRRSSKNKQTGFEKYCQIELSRIKKARTSSSRNRTVKSYQKCLNKRGIHTGLKEKKEKSK